MRALVTGISGFVGGHLAEHLIDQGDVIVGISASGRWPRDLEHLSQDARIERFNLIEGTEADLADLITRKQPEVIYHLAAWSNPQKSMADPRGTWALNLGGSLSLLEAVRVSGLKPRVVLVGTGVSYGNPGPEWIPVTEACPVRPNNPYAASKAAVDLLGVQYFLAHRTNVVMVRPFNHAGPRQSPTYALAGWAHQIALLESGRGERLEVGNLEVTRDFTDVRDVVRGYRMLAEKGEPGEIYNLGSGLGVRLAWALEHLCSLANIPITAHVDPARVRPVDQPLLVADASKLKAAVGWTPRFTIEQTLADMLEDARNTIAREGVPHAV